MSKAEQTRAFIIEKAAPIFNTKGYAGTSLSDVMEATGLTKGSIYGNFENKDDVALAVYNYNVERYHSWLDSYLNTAPTPGDKIIAITTYYRENWKRMAERGGCPMLNASIEADDNLPFLKKDVQNSVKRLAQKIGGIIDAGKKTGEFRTGISSTEYAYAIITLIEGSIMLFKIEGNIKRLFAGLDRIVKILNEEIKK